MEEAAAVVIGVGPAGDRHLDAVAAACRAHGRSFVTLDYTTLPRRGLSIRLSERGVGTVRLDGFATTFPRVHSHLVATS